MIAITLMTATNAPTTAVAMQAGTPVAISVPATVAASAVVTATGTLSGPSHHSGSGGAASGPENHGLSRAGPDLVICVRPSCVATLPVAAALLKKARDGSLGYLVPCLKSNPTV